MKIRVMPFLSRKGNRVAKAAIEFEDFCGAGSCQLVGFTICDDAERGLFVLFPSSVIKRGEDTKPYFFLRPGDDKVLQRLQDAILDIYESMIGFNRPSLVAAPTAVN